MDEEGYYIAFRVKEMPIPVILCERGKCTECGEDVWLDENTRRVWESMQVICMTCLEEKKPDELELMVPREILESLDKFFKRRKELMKK